MKKANCERAVGTCFLTEVTNQSKAEEGGENSDGCSERHHPGLWAGICIRHIDDIVYSSSLWFFAVSKTFSASLHHHYDV